MHHVSRRLRFVLVAFLFAATLRAQGYLLESLTGPGPASLFGSSVTGLADLNGDGVRELAVGSIGNGIGGTVRIYAGGSGLDLGGFGAESPNEGVGWAMASTTEAGSPRLLVGTPFRSAPTIVPGLLNAVGGANIVTIATAFAVNGVAANEEFGASIASIGDVNGDQIPDILVGSPGFQTAVVFGRARVLSGRTGGVIRTHSGSLLNQHSHFGAAVLGLPDVDADGVLDYAIADPQSDAGGNNAGQIRVFSGATGTLLWFRNGAAAGDQFGMTMITARRDGIFGIVETFVVVASPLASFTGAVNAGRVDVLNLFTGSPILSFLGPNFVSAGGLFGLGLAEVNSEASSSARNLAVGAPNAAVGSNADAGRVFVFSLSSGLLNLNLPNPNPVNGDGFGAALAGSADLDGDGDDTDFVVAAPGNGSNDAGQVFSFTVNGSSIAAFSGTLAAAELGTALALTGDWNGDGAVDFAAGNFLGGVEVHSGASGSLLATFVTSAQSVDGIALASAGTPGRSHQKRFGLLMGKPFADPNSLNAAGLIATTVVLDAGLLAGPQEVGASAGHSVAFVGDLDADGKGEIAVGVPFADALNSQDAGLVKIYSGASFQSQFDIAGTVAGERLGSAVAGAGDLSGDGVPDILAGAPGADHVLGTQDVGRIRIFSGVNGGFLAAIGGLTSDRNLGSTLASLGDINGDGVPDFAGGAPVPSGSSPLQSARVRVYSGANQAVIRTHLGALGGDAFGTALDGSGDFDGDGIRDLIIGIPETNPFPSPVLNAGAIRVLSGATGTLLELFTGPNAANARFGQAVAFAGDFNGDCRPEILGGAPFVPNGNVRLLSRFGIPSQSLLFGSGCAGSGGITPVITTFGGTPTAQGLPGFGIQLTCALGGAQAFLLLGLSNTTWNGFSLPLNTGVLGINGCTLLVAADLILPFTTSGSGPGTGAVAVPIPIPADPALANLHAYLQWFVIDGGAPNSLAAMSRALDLKILQIP